MEEWTCRDDQGRVPFFLLHAAIGGARWIGSTCGPENDAGRRFCGECGSALARECPTCGSPNPPTVKYCGECGSLPAPTGRTARAAAPATQPSPATERRLISVLF